MNTAELRRRLFFGAGKRLQEIAGEMVPHLPAEEVGRIFIAVGLGVFEMSGADLADYLRRLANEVEAHGAPHDVH